MDVRLSELAIKQAVRAALIEHKALGYSIAVADGDGVRIVPPEEIVIPPEPKLEDDGGLGSSRGD
jgi:hypothetical protein